MTPVPSGSSGTPRGGPVAASGRGADNLATVKCLACGANVAADLPFCGQCGARVSQARAGLACSRCGRVNDAGYKFCPACANPIADTGPHEIARGAGATVGARDAAPHIALLDRTGQAVQQFALHGAVTTVGRQGADVNFPDDSYLSPVHAQFLLVDGVLTVRDLGSRNGTWFYLDQPQRLVDGDLMLVGSQILRYRRLGYPGPRPPEQDQTRRLGSLTPSADIANLAQIRADGSARDIIHLSPGRTIRIGREQGDWQFPFDSSMSSLHALIRSEDADFVVVDAGSRNGVALAIRGERKMDFHTRLLIGDQMIRIESA